MSDLYDNVYEPAEDSFLLTDVILDYLGNLKKNNLDICEIGVGSGYVISTIASKYKDNFFYGSDINEDAINSTNNRFNSLDNKIVLKKGNLLEPFEKKFDLVFFNTPYLPLEDGEKFEDLSLKDKAIYGGKKGYEVILEFIYQLNDKLDNDGICFMLFSSYSKFNKISEEIEKQGFVYEIGKEESHFFEKLYVLKISKSNTLKELSENNLNKIRYFTAGKHSKVFHGFYQNKEVIIKYADSGIIMKENTFLEKLSKKNYVPKKYLNGENFLALEKIEGSLPKEVFFNFSRDEIISFLQKCLDICYDLDFILIQKFEMTNPYKHIFYTSEKKVIFIDFERSIFNENPKNTRQFLQFIVRNQKYLNNKDINLNVDSIRSLQKDLKSKKIKIVMKNLILS